MSKSRNFSIALTGFAATLAFASSALAADNIVKKSARQNDVAASYSLNKTSTKFTRAIEKSDGTVSCTVTTGVEDFKISQHPNDVATVYFVKDGGLHYLADTKKNGGYYSGNCPPADSKRLITSLKYSGGKAEYGVIPSTNTEYVNWGLRSDGTFLAWKNSGQPLSVYNISDIASNTCYDQEGKSYSRKILFLQKHDGRVLAMENDGSMTDQGVHKSIQSFKNSRNVCEDKGDSRRLRLGAPATEAPEAEGSAGGAR